MKKLETVFSVFLVGVLLLPSLSFGQTNIWKGPTTPFSSTAPAPELPVDQGRTTQGKQGTIASPQLNISSEVIDGISVTPTVRSLILDSGKGIYWGSNYINTVAGFLNTKNFEGLTLPAPAVEPSKVVGSIYYDSEKKEVKLYDGTDWKSIGSDAINSSQWANVGGNIAYGFSKAFPSPKHGGAAIKGDQLTVNQFCIEDASTADSIKYTNGIWNISSPRIVDFAYYDGTKWSTAEGNIKVATTATCFVGNNVGIGKNNPDYKLDVNGPINGSQVCIAGVCKSAWPVVAGNQSSTFTEPVTIDLSAKSGEPGRDSLILNSSADNDFSAILTNKPKFGIYSTSNVDWSDLIVGNLSVASGKDLVFSAKLGSPNDAGDLAFQNFSGGQKGRIWTDASTDARLNFSSGDLNPDLIINSAGLVEISGSGSDGGLKLNGRPIYTLSGPEDPYYYIKSSTTYLGGLIAQHYGGFHFKTQNEKERLTITEDGNVGIGTDDPKAKLVINSGENTDSAILATTNENNALVVKSYDSSLESGTNKSLPTFGITQKFGTSENNGFIKFYRGSDTSGGFLTLGTNGLEKVRIDTNGNVGIGTDAPNKSLHVYKDSGDNAEIDIQSVAGAGNQWGIYVASSTNQLRFWQGDNRLVITKDGNVGIGTDSPEGILDVLGDGDINLKKGSRNGAVNIGSSGGLVPLNIFGDLVVSSVPLSSPTGYFYRLIENRSSLPDPIYDNAGGADFDWWKTAFPLEFGSYPSGNNGWDAIKISNTRTNSKCEDTGLTSTQCVSNTYEAVGSAPEYVYDLSRFKEEGVTNFSISYRKFQKIASQFSGGSLNASGPGSFGGSLTINLPDVNKEVNSSGRDALILNSGGNNDSTVVKINRDKIWFYSSQLNSDANLQAGRANFSGSISSSVTGESFAGRFINFSGGLGVLSNSLKLESNLSSSYYLAQFIYDRTVTSDPGLTKLNAFCGFLLGPCPEIINATDDPSVKLNSIPDLSTKSAGFEAQLTVGGLWTDTYRIYKLFSDPTKKDKVFEITSSSGNQILSVDDSGNTDVSGDVNISNDVNIYGSITSNLKIKSNPILNGTQTYSIVGGCHTKNGGTCEDASVFGNIIPNDGGQIKCPAGNKKIGEPTTIAGAVVFCIK